MAGEQDPKSLLGLSPTSERLAAYTDKLASLVSTSAASPEVKAYPDAVYYNYYTVGLSLLFAPTTGYRPKTGSTLEQLDTSKLALDGIDIYNASSKKPTDGKPARALSNPAYSPYSMSPFTVAILPGGKDDKTRKDTSLTIGPETTGKDFVALLGEPDRKGGGSGPSSGSIGIWLEWSKDGLMVEFGGDESRGPQAWEKGKDAIWSVVSIFTPK
ncbi:hypothetical protein PENSPDRAFT_645741 [Peniophora sp. CONT]|nr:hypothetical protein PENSPDRAFT_645741 [Peniophora sp. CONT]